tara:strand:- start:162 stop:986 length:825 start_codon:yes stop_codon:yes gene_type:complete
VNRSLPLALLLLTLWLAPSQADVVAPLHSATVTTKLRTLRGLPLKRLITSAKGWRRVTADLADAPPAPAFAQGEVCVLIVVDESGGAASWVEKIETHPKQAGLRIKVLRRDGEVSLEPSLKAFFLRFKAFQGGIELVHTTRLPEDQGTIERKFKADPADTVRKRLPRLGPDLRFRVKTPDGVRPEGLKLRHETRFPGQKHPAKLATTDLPLGMAFPRVRRGTREHHVFAVYSSDFRCEKALLYDQMPPAGADGSPQPIKHTFLLERRPAGPERR